MAEYVLAMTGAEVNAALTKAQTDVSYNTAQSLTDAQKAIARSNIGAMEAKSVVEYTTQSLNDQQKQVARNNIGAGDAAAVDTLSDTVSGLQTASGQKLDYTQTQTLTDAQKSQARANMGLNPIEYDTSMKMSVGIDSDGHLWAESFEEPDITNWEQVAQIIKSGAAPKFFEVGDQFAVNKATAVTAAVMGNITDATVDLQTFITQMNEVEAKSYTFLFIDGQWLYKGDAVVLSDYGITVTGTPASLDKIIVTETIQEIVFDVLDFDYDTPVAEGIHHTMSLLAHNVLGSSAFDAREALFYVDPDVYDDDDDDNKGLPIGTYNITLVNGKYNGGAAQDGTYQFTTTKVVPPGGLIYHTEMGRFKSASVGYNKKQITDGKFKTYDTDYNEIETLDTTEGSDGISLEITTSHDPGDRTNTLLNFTERNGQGSNNWLNSGVRQRLNSNAAGAANDAIASWWTSKNIWDMPIKVTDPGFLYGLDPSFCAIIQTVKKRTALASADYSSGSVNYIDHDERVFLPSVVEVNAYSATPNVYETSFGTDTTFSEIKTGPYAFYTNANDSDRIKYNLSETVARWRLRSPRTTGACNASRIDPDGKLVSSYAWESYGFAPALCIG